jgi:carbon storage regulator
MLVLTRKIYETIVIGGKIRITITAIRGRQVRIAIDAPEHLSIIRGELVEIPATESAEAIGPRQPS